MYTADQISLDSALFAWRLLCEARYTKCKYGDYSYAEQKEFHNHVVMTHAYGSTFFSH